MNIISDAIWLNADNNVGYGALSIPNERDKQIRSLLDSWLSLPLNERHHTFASAEQKSTLLAFGERMASQAVRTRSREDVVYGLLAIGLDNFSGDWRDCMQVISLHYDALQKLRERPESVFSEIAGKLPANTANVFQSFLKRSDEDKSIQAMGYREATDKDGFRYAYDD